jgi:thioredoxin 1
MSTIDLTETTFEGTVRREGIVVIDWWATWCGPCRAFAPVFEQTANAHEDVVFAKVDTDAEPGLAGAFEVRAIPTLSILRDGIMLFHRSGMLSRSAIEDLLRQARALDMDQVKRDVEASGSAEAR